MNFLSDRLMDKSHSQTQEEIAGYCVLFN